MGFKLRATATKEDRSEISSTLLMGLSSSEAQSVLHRLLEQRPDLRQIAEALSERVLTGISFEEVAHEVEHAIEGVSSDDLGSRAGRHEWGYTEPTEAAWELFDEAITPFVADMTRYLELGVYGAAFEVCKGVVLGLYRAHIGRGTDVLEYAPDFPLESATDAAELWRTKSGDRATKSVPTADRLREFAEEHLPDWSSLLERRM